MMDRTCREDWSSWVLGDATAVGSLPSPNFGLISSASEVLS
jgi:hypothetical protein